MSKPETVICHIDVNSAFLSWTAVYRTQVLGEELDLRSVPSAVCGDIEARHGVILAKSGSAKRFGVKTGESLFQARQKCPQLLVVPPDYALYAAASRKFIALLREMAPVVEQYSIDEAWADISGTEGLYGPPLLAAARIKDRIRDELGFTVNIGVSSNKLLAKMAGEFEKPDKVHTLFPWELEKKLWPLPVRELFMVGAASEKKLHSMGITTIGQLAQADPARLKARLHKHGLLIWNFANGRCEDEVSDALALNKGYGNSVTTPRDVTTSALAHKILLSLSETVGMRMRKDRQAGLTVSVSIRSADFENRMHQRQLPQPSDSTAEIYAAARRIFDEMWDGTPLRQLGVYVSRVGRNMGRQISLFDGDGYEKQAETDRVIDSIRERFGEQAIMRATFLQPGVEPMSGGLSKERRSGVTKPLGEEDS
ncbi:MAG: DNA polymerase IV [Bacillota bacterium]|nr:DNA polymerase IV [Bacillota bacterium]